MARVSRLGEVTLLDCPREIKRPGHGEEVVDLIHFHARGTLGLPEGWLVCVRSVGLERFFSVEMLGAHAFWRLGSSRNCDAFARFRPAREPTPRSTSRAR
jgi:hypothetical protein